MRLGAALQGLPGQPPQLEVGERDPPQHEGKHRLTNDKKTIYRPGDVRPAQPVQSVRLTRPQSQARKNLLQPSAQQRQISMHLCQVLEFELSSLWHE